VASNVTVRRFRDEDAEATARLFFEAVHRGTSPFYDEAERNAWAPRIPETSAWLDRLKPQSVFVAEMDGQVVGFMTLRSDGCVDLAYVLPEMMGQGIAKELHRHTLREAARLGLRKLRADASHLARPFFERQGWTVVRRQCVHRAGVALANSAMEKLLP